MRAINHRPPWSQSSARVATISLFDMSHLITSVKMASRCTSQISWKNKNLSQSRISGAYQVNYRENNQFLCWCIEIQIRAHLSILSKAKKKKSLDFCDLFISEPPIWNEINNKTRWKEVNNNTDWYVCAWLLSSGRTLQDVLKSPWDCGLKTQKNGPSLSQYI